MLTPPQIVYAAHGSPPVDGCSEASGRCYVCVGSVTRGKPVADWLSSNFTDQARCRSPLSTHVCEACCYVMSRTSPVLGRPPGVCKVCDGTLAVVRVPSAGRGKGATVGDECPKCKGTGMQAEGGNFRSFSHLHESSWDSPPFAPVKDDEGNVTRHNGPPGLGYINASKGEKPIIRDFIAREHTGAWCAVVADSGQKHCLPFGVLNGPGGRSGLVLFEETLVHVPDDQSLVDDMTELLTAGVTKDEIESGQWYVRTMRENREAAMTFEARHGPARGSGWYRLAIWLAQRDEEEFATVEAARKEKQDAKRSAEKKARNARSGDGSQSPRRVPQRAKRKAADELLGADPEPVPSSGAPVDDGERVGKRGAAKTAGPGATQRRLPGFD